ncbi:hypothetical protein HMPREF0493_0170 [Lactobacillus amylolyticus DSM 11664]|uniref:Uncharacterized protein n=1 Tax=Lactobacillus amylolyticus DSM 11664 TaxID=585524 RepID=D4YRP2_9LACO|nr:hypothetical protein HMPREF0493_0170 [Lactobacillus amylolyticus DSM 11664]
MNLGLRHNKTDIALIQMLHHHTVNQIQSQAYKQLKSLRLKLYFILPKAKITSK